MLKTILFIALCSFFAGLVVMGVLARAFRDRERPFQTSLDLHTVRLICGPGPLAYHLGHDGLLQIWIGPYQSEAGGEAVRYVIPSGKHAWQMRADVIGERITARPKETVGDVPRHYVPV